MNVLSVGDTISFKGGWNNYLVAEADHLYACLLCTSFVRVEHYDGVFCSKEGQKCWIPQRASYLFELSCF